MQTAESRSNTQTICLVVLTAAIATYMIYWLRPVLVPLVVAVFVVSGVGPILKTLEVRLGVSRLVAAVLTFIAGLAVLVVFGCSLWVSVLDLSNNSDRYRARVKELVDRVENMFPMELSLKDADMMRREDAPSESEEDARGNPATDQTNSDGQQSATGAAEADTAEESSNGEEPQALVPPSNDGDKSVTEATQAGADGEDRDQGATATEQADPPQSVVATTQPRPERSPIVAPIAPTPNPVVPTIRPKSHEKVAEFVDRFISEGIAVVSQTMISLVSTSVVVLIYVFFLLLGTPSDLNSSGTWREVDHQIRSYLTLKTIISIFTGFAFGLSLRLFGVPMALTFGVLAFLLNFIPNVGPLVASLLPIPLILLDPSGSVGWMISVIAVTCSIQLISGNIVEPKIMGDSSDLHPVTILLALMFWGMMWGIVGMFLATPIMAGLKIILERIEMTRPVADIMAGRLPKEPIFPTTAET